MDADIDGVVAEVGRHVDEPAVEVSDLGRGLAGLDVLQHGALVVLDAQPAAVQHVPQPRLGKPRRELRPQRGDAAALRVRREDGLVARVRDEGLQDAARRGEHEVHDLRGDAVRRGEQPARLAAQDGRQRVNARVDDELLELQHPDVEAAEGLGREDRRARDLRGKIRGAGRRGGGASRALQQDGAEVGVGGRGKDAAEGARRVEPVVGDAEQGVEAVAGGEARGHVGGAVRRPQLGHAVLCKGHRGLRAKVAAHAVHLGQCGLRLGRDKEVLDGAAVGCFANGGRETTGLGRRLLLRPPFNVKVLAGVHLAVVCGDFDAVALVPLREELLAMDNERDGRRIGARTDVQGV